MAAKPRILDLDMQRLEDVLRRAEATLREDDYALLKAYLMVTDRRRLEIDATLPVVIGQWRKRRTDTLLARIVRSCFAGEEGKTHRPE